MGTNCGLMGRSTRDTGGMTRRMGMGSWYMQMVMCMRVSGLMIRHMARVLTRMPMERTTMEIGWKISSMDGAWNLGQMVQNMKVNISMGRKTAGVNLPSQMVASTMENSEITRSAAKVNTTGLMVSTTRATGSETKCMATECSLGRTGSAMKENSPMIKERAMAPLYGKMAASI